MEGFHAYEFLLMKKLKEGALLFENKFTCKNTSDFRFGHYEKTSNLKLIVIVMNSHLRVKQWENHNDISLSDPTVHINLIKKRSVIIVDDENNIKYKNISPDFWFLSAALEKCPNKVLSFLNSEIKRIQEPHVSEQTVLDRYLMGSNIIEMHLDGVFKLGENAVLPIELFKCTNVKILSLKNNNLKRIPPDIGRLSQLEYLALTNNDLRNSSIPLTLTFCTQLQHLYVDNNMLDALPGFLLQMPQLVTVHRHGNHNYFKSTFMWYYTEINNRILHVKREAQKTPKKEQTLFQPDTLELLSAQAVIASKQNFFVPNYLPVVLQDYIAHVYPKFSVCGYCNSAKSSSVLGFKVFTFKNPYLGNTCVPFQHWACSQQCAEAIEIPAHREQMKNAQKSDRQYLEYINYIQNQQVSAVQKKPTCSIM